MCPQQVQKMKGATGGSWEEKALQEQNGIKAKAEVGLGEGLFQTHTHTYDDVN